MWSTLSRTDLETVKRQLMSCREQMLRRHAEELEALNIDTAELEALDQLIGAFTEKFKPATIGIPERATTGQSQRTEKSAERSVEETISASVSFLITQAQKLRLRTLGIGEEEIRNMRPDEAHRILGVAS